MAESSRTPYVDYSPPPLPGPDQVFYQFLDTGQHIRNLEPLFKNLLCICIAGQAASIEFIALWYKLWSDDNKCDQMTISVKTITRECSITSNDRNMSYPVSSNPCTMMQLIGCHWRWGIICLLMAQACQIPEAQRDLQKATGPQSYSHASMAPVTNLAQTASRGSKHGRDIDDSSQEVSSFLSSFAPFTASLSRGDSLFSSALLCFCTFNNQNRPLWCELETCISNVAGPKVSFIRLHYSWGCRVYPR